MASLQPHAHFLSSVKEIHRAGGYAIKEKSVKIGPMSFKYEEISIFVLPIFWITHWPVLCFREMSWQNIVCSISECLNWICCDVCKASLQLSQLHSDLPSFQYPMLLFYNTIINQWIKISFFLFNSHFIWKCGIIR